ncbi:MAG: hypothetical protein GYA34_02035 [Chloroflexi bacterium]|nr:hypothetical protein [Chloroflexota bacterium]
MKIQIIQLETHDDYISTRDKIGWSKAGRILLVIPERSAALTRELDLVLLKRHCDSLGAQMALVSKDKNICFRARHLGIPHFSSVANASRKTWRIRNQEKLNKNFELKSSETSNRQKIQTLKALVLSQRPSLSNRIEFRLLFFIIGVLAVLAIAAVLMPTANIILEPEIISQEVTVQVAANPDQKSVKISGAIPAQMISVIVEGRDQISSSGTIEIDDQPAIGSVEFSNLTDKAVTVPKGTIVRTPGDLPVRFTTQKEITVEAGYGITNSVPVRAIKPGIIGNLEEGSLTIIEGTLGINLLVNNPSPTSGGNTRTSPAPSASDKTQLFEKLRSALVQSALTEVNGQLKKGDILLSSKPASIKVIDQIFDPEEDYPADQLKLTLQLECSFLVAQAEDLLKLATLSMDVNLPKNYSVIEDSTNIKNMTAPIGSGNHTYRWQIIANRNIQAIIDPAQAISLIIGLPPEEAIHRLDQNLPLRDTPQIILTPSWWRRLPFLPFRMNISIQS